MRGNQGEGRIEKRIPTVQGPMAFRWYQAKLRTAPLLTQSVTTAVCFVFLEIWTRKKSDIAIRGAHTADIPWGRVSRFSSQPATRLPNKPSRNAVSNNMILCVLPAWQPMVAVRLFDPFHDHTNAHILTHPSHFWPCRHKMVRPPNQAHQYPLLSHGYDLRPRRRRSIYLRACQYGRLPHEHGIPRGRQRAPAPYRRIPPWIPEEPDGVALGPIRQF